MAFICALGFIACFFSGILLAQERPPRPGLVLLCFLVAAACAFAVLSTLPENR